MIKGSRRLTLLAASFMLVAWGLAVPAASGQTGPAQASAPAPAADPQAARRAQAYYHYALGHLLEDMAGFTSRSDYLQRAIEEFKQALQYDPESSFLTVRLAEAYRRGGRIRDAVLEAEAVLKTDPDNLPARRLLGRIYVETLGELQPGQSDKRTLELALQQYEAIARLVPDDIESRLLLARLYRLNNEPEKSEATLERLLAAQPRSEQVLGALAQLYSDQGEYSKAIQLLKNATAQEPSPQLLATLAYAYERAGDLGNAVAAYRRALDQDADNVELRQRLAQLFIESGRYDAAITEFQTLARLNPEDFQAHLRLSQLYRQRGRFDQAQAYLARARELDPENLEVALNQALLHEAEGKFSEAVQVLSDLVASNTRSNGNYNQQERRARAVLLEQLGQLHRRLEQYDAAVETFDRMLELGEQEAMRGYSQIIETLRQARSLDLAIARTRQASERFPEVTSFQLHLATLLGDRGDLPQAVALARSFLKGQSDDREILLTLAQVYERNKHYEEAERAVAEAEKLSTGRAELEFVYFLRAAIYERQKKYDPAEREFRRVLEMNPASAITLNYLGYMLADRGVQLQESVELVKRALEIEPYNGAYLDSLGWAYYRLNQLDLAEEYLRKAIQRVSRDPTIHDHLGDLYEKRGRLDLAETHWERALAEWKRMPKTEFDPEAFAKLEAKLRALKSRLANQTRK